jgi:hypothetical protein
VNYQNFIVFWAGCNRKIYIFQHNSFIIMSKLKDFYVKTIGHSYERIENSPWYLSKLALHGAIEIGKYLLEGNHDFSHVQELAGILERHQLEDTDTASTAHHFPYFPLWKAVRDKSNKNIRLMSELALEMRLLRSELGDVPANSKRLEELYSLLCDLSREFSNEQYRYNYPRRLAA